MSTHHHAAPTIARGPLLAVGALLLFAVLAAGGVRLSGQSIRAPDAQPSAQRMLKFVDRPDGGVDVIDAGDGRVFDRIGGQAGFLRGALRGLVRERKRMGLGPEAPFALIGRADGRLTLADPATGQVIDLESFGPTNAAVFARLLAAR